jgi:hypothetical protein
MTQSTHGATSMGNFAVSQLFVYPRLKAIIMHERTSAFGHFSKFITPASSKAKSLHHHRKTVLKIMHVQVVVAALHVCIIPLHFVNSHGGVRVLGGQNAKQGKCNGGHSRYLHLTCRCAIEEKIATA